MVKIDIRHGDYFFVSLWLIDDDLQDIMRKSLLMRLQGIFYSITLCHYSKCACGNEFKVIAKFSVALPNRGKFYP